MVENSAGDHRRRHSGGRATWGADVRFPTLLQGVVDELELASRLAEHGADDGRPLPIIVQVDRLGVDFRQTTYKEDGGERAPAKLVCPVWSQRTCRRTDGGRS